MRNIVAATVGHGHVADADLSLEVISFPHQAHELNHALSK